ncbi:MAG TPA: VanZ family protein [Steroidobacter sp.]|nr:VanZ family protein [Steroidobacter sp.]
MLLPLRHPRVWLLIGWLLVVLAITASLLPGQRLPPTGVNDKLEHMAAYTVLALWFAGIYPRSRYVALAVALFLMGVVVEFAQGAMHLGRERDLRDVIANSAGISLGLSIAVLRLGGWAQRLEAWAARKP